MVFLSDPSIDGGRDLIVFMVSEGRVGRFVAGGVATNGAEVTRVRSTEVAARWALLGRGLDEDRLWSDRKTGVRACLAGFGGRTAGLGGSSTSSGL